MKLTKKAQVLMDALEDAFADIDFNDPIAILRYDDRETKISEEIFNYDYGDGKDDKEGPKSHEAAMEHKKLREFLKNIQPDDVEIEIISEEDRINDGLEMILDSLEDDCLFDNLR